MTTLGSIAYGAQIASAAIRNHLDPTLLAAVAAQETGGPGSDSGANVVGDHGHGHGLFQIDDRWHAFAATPAAMDPGANADYAAGMLRGLLDRYGGNVHMALSAYNAGSPTATGTTTDWGGGQVLGYADSVLAHQARLTGGTSATALAARDAAVPDLAATTGSVNALQSIASLLQGQDIDTSAVSSASPISLPQPTDYNAHNEQPLGEDLGADDGGADLDPTPSRSNPTA
jgi:hypothetical protein